MNPTVARRLQQHSGLSLSPSALGLTPAQRAIAAQNAAQQNAYRALNWSPSRQPINPVVLSTDREFLGVRRQLATNTAYDLDHNFALWGKMVRTHQTYTSLNEFMPASDDPVYDRELKAWYEERNDPDTVDAQGKRTIEEIITTFAGLKVFGGFAFILKCQNGQLQLFENWNMAKGEGAPPEVNDHGYIADLAGKIVKIAIATGDSSANLVHRYLADRSEVIIDGFSSRTAGHLWESPLLPAMNHARDLLDAHSYYLLKCKIAAMFGFYWFRDSQKKSALDFTYQQGTGGGNPGLDSTGQATAAAPVQPAMPLVELKPGMVIQGEQNDKAGFLESQSPPAEFVAMEIETGRLILDALDIPLSFEHPDRANYSSMRADANRYKNSCHRERTKNARAQRKCTDHVMRAGIADRTMPIHSKLNGKLPRYMLVPKGIFLLDASKEMPAILAKLNAGLDDFESSCHELGTGNFFDKIDLQARQRAYAAAKKVPLNLGNVSIALKNTDDPPEGRDGSPSRPSED